MQTSDPATSLPLDTQPKTRYHHLTSTDVKMASAIPTRIIVLSDTHGDGLNKDCLAAADVVLHCGDLTEESKLHEFETAIATLKTLHAPVKLVIAGNHDFTLDIPTFRTKLAAITPALDAPLVQREYGGFGEARALFERADVVQAGIRLLGEGTHRIGLANGALLTVYASPYTASLSADWGFQYLPEHDHVWDIQPDTDIVITHGPPKGMLDRAEGGTRCGSESLFAAVARARPLVHCFGHIHEGWGARKVHWNDALTSSPSHFTSIDNARSVSVESLASINPSKHDDAVAIAEKRLKLDGYKKQGYCSTTDCSVKRGQQTLFVNAAIEGPDEHQQQLPWLATIDLASGGDSSAPATAWLNRKRDRASVTRPSGGAEEKKACRAV